MPFDLAPLSIKYREALKFPMQYPEPFPVSKGRIALGGGGKLKWFFFVMPRTCNSAMCATY